MLFVAGLSFGLVIGVVIGVAGTLFWVLQQEDHEWPRK